MEAPAQAPVAPVEHADDAVHAVNDEAVPDDRGRRGHLAARWVVLPDHLAVAHVQRVDRALVIADVGDPARDHGRELDQSPDSARPDDLERRPELDVAVRLSPAGVGAVHRPLQRVAVEPDRHLPVLLERHPHDARRISGLRDTNRERRAPLDLHRGEAGGVRIPRAVADHDPRAPDAAVRVAVDDRDERPSPPASAQGTHARPADQPARPPT